MLFSFPKENSSKYLNSSSCTQSIPSSSWQQQHLVCDPCWQTTRYCSFIERMFSPCPWFFQAICLEQGFVALPSKWASNQHWILVVLTNVKHLHNVENCCLQIVLSNGNQNFAGSDIDLKVAVDTVMPWRLQCKNKEYSFTIAWNPCCCWIYTLFADDFIMIYSDFIKRCNLTAFSLITALWGGAESGCI